MSETLETLYKNIARTRKEANINLDELPSTIRGSWTTRVSEAKNTLNRLVSEYKDVVLNNCLGIFLNGPEDKVAAFTDLIRAKEEGLSINANALYQILTDEVEPLFGTQRQWGIDQSYRLRGAMTRALAYIGVAEIMAPDTSRPAPTPDAAATMSYLKDIIREANGDELNVLYLRYELGEQAVQMGCTGNTVPVFVTNATETESQSLSKVFGDRPVLNLTLKEDDEVTEEFLSKTFQSLAKKAKTKK